MTDIAAGLDGQELTASRAEDQLRSAEHSAELIIAALRLQLGVARLDDPVLLNRVRRCLRSFAALSQLRTLLNPRLYHYLRLPFVDTPFYTQLSSSLLAYLISIYR
jgi:hypothetical protein